MVGPIVSVKDFATAASEVKEAGSVPHCWFESSNVMDTDPVDSGDRDEKVAG